jgi:NAD(P)H-dependent FMN reductase
MKWPAREDESMKNRYVAILAIVGGFSLLGSARANDLKSKLTDMAAAVAGNSEATSQQQEVASAPVDEAEQQALQAEAEDAVNHALENARAEQQ